MKFDKKLVKKVGWMPVNIGGLLLSLVIIVMALIWQQSQNNSQQEQQSQYYQQQVFNGLLTHVGQQFQWWQAELDRLAGQEAALNLVSASDEDVQQWQTQQRKLIPSVEQLCFVKSIPAAPDDKTCLPIGFASLNALRQLKHDGHSDIVYIKNADKPYLLFTAAVKNEDGEFLGALMMAVNSSVLSELIAKPFVAKGYWELAQGNSATSIISRFGNAGLRSETALFQQKISGSYLQFNYWPERAESTSALLSALILAVVIALIWVLQQLWLYVVLKHDADNLCQQVVDYEELALKPSYALCLPVFQSVTDAIHRLAAVHGVKKKRSEIAPENLTAVKVNESLKKSAENTIVVHEFGTETPSDSVDISDIEVKEETDVTEPALEFSVNMDAEVETDVGLSLESSDISIDSAVSQGGGNDSIFKTYDIRGVVGAQLNEQVMIQLGQAVGSEALDQHQRQLVVGRDGRSSSESLSEAFITGVLSSGCNVIDIGAVPTPVMYFACEHLGTHSGAAITASHNPAEYNGLKVVIAGKSLSEDGIQQLKQRIDERRFRQGQGQLSLQDVEQDYFERIKSDVKIARKMRVVVDCGNGIAGKTVPTLLTSLGCDVIELYCHVDGRFPHHHPDPSRPANLQDLVHAVIEHEAELGLAFDGDGDRLGVVDGKGEIIWPDRLMMLLARHLLIEHPGAAIIYDVKSTNLLADVIARGGGQAIMSPSGYSIIKSKMLEVDAQLAGELSGHIFFRDRWYGFDDALYSAARLLEFLALDPLERTPTEVFAALPKRITTPEILVAMTTEDARDLIEKLQNQGEFKYGKLTLIDGVRVDYPYGWGLIRASNTMPGVTLRFEASSEESLEQIKQVFIKQVTRIKPDLSLTI